MPDYGQARGSLDTALAQRADVLKELAQQRESLQSSPNDLALLNDLAGTLATNPNGSVRNGAEAVDFAQRAVKLSGGRDPAILAASGSRLCRSAAVLRRGANRAQGRRPCRPTRQAGLGGISQNPDSALRSEDALSPDAAILCPAFC